MLITREGLECFKQRWLAGDALRSFGGRLEEAKDPCLDPAWSLAKQAAVPPPTEPAEHP